VVVGSAYCVRPVTVVRLRASVIDDDSGVRSNDVVKPLAFVVLSSRPPFLYAVVVSWPRASVVLITRPPASRSKWVTAFRVASVIVDNRPAKS